MINHPDMETLQRSFELVDQANDQTFQLVYEMEGLMAIEYLEALTKAAHGDLDAMRQLWHFLVQTGAAIQVLLAAPPGSEPSLEE